MWDCPEPFFFSFFLSSLLPSHLIVWGGKKGLSTHGSPYDDDPRSSSPGWGGKRSPQPSGQKVLSTEPFKRKLDLERHNTDCLSEAYNLGDTILFFTICLKGKKSNIKPGKILINDRVHICLYVTTGTVLELWQRGREKTGSWIGKWFLSAGEFKKVFFFFLRFQISKIQNTVSVYRPCQSFLQSSNFRTECMLQSKHTWWYF